MSHKVIIIPGLGDGTERIEWATNFYHKYGLEPVVHNMWWRKGEKHFEPKLKKLISLVDKLSKNGDRVSLIGTSAGSSAVMNAFVARKKKIYKVISVCGRLRQGEEKGFRSFEAKTASSLAFKESVLRFEKSELKLTKEDKKKIMTISAIFDELVPGNTSRIKGAVNKQIKSVEHMFSIWMGLSFYKPLIKFLIF
jgi:hypothetical protein